MNYHYVSTRMARMKKTTPNIVKNVKQKELSFTADGTNWQLPVKTEQYLPYDPTIPILGMYQKELKTHAH